MGRGINVIKKLCPGRKINIKMQGVTLEILGKYHIDG